MVARVVDELRLVFAVGIPGYGVGHGPPGESPGALFNIVLGVVDLAVHADAHGKQLQELTAPVLIDGVFVAHAIVQVEHHGRVFGQTLQEIVEFAQAVAPEHVKLDRLLLGVLALGMARDEDLMPEQGNLFFQRTLGVDHAVGPFFLLTF